VTTVTKTLDWIRHPYPISGVNRLKSWDCGTQRHDVQTLDYKHPKPEPQFSNDVYRSSNLGHQWHGLMARGGHGLPKVSLRPAMFYPSMPCGRATPEAVLQPFLGWPVLRAGGVWLSSIPLDTPCPTPMVSLVGQNWDGVLGPS
jgi:hypothetical protein